MGEAVGDTERTYRPAGDPLALILHRLDSIERRMDRLMTAELAAARYEAMEQRVRALEVEQQDNQRAIRQIVIALVTAILTGAVAGGLVIS